LKVDDQRSRTERVTSVDHPEAGARDDNASEPQDFDLRQSVRLQDSFASLLGRAPRDRLQATLNRIAEAARPHDGDEQRS
jgi:hypothetical protein